MYFWIGIIIMAIAAFFGWCLCRASANADRAIDKLLGMPDINDVNVEDVE